jgi:AcrR family transcriptional regulator
VTATRRPRGEPRRLLLLAAREQFANQDYRSTTTREIAESAGVAEHLLFRNFGSKAALFREALVDPFVEVVETFTEATNVVAFDMSRAEELGAQFIGAVYDLFAANRGLVMTLWAADAMDPEERADAGLVDISRAIASLGRMGSERLMASGVQSKRHDLAGHSTVAMIAGMAAFGSTLFSGRKPSRDAIVRELTEATLHGFLHRD